MTLTDIRDLILVYDGLRDIERCIVLLCNQDIAIGYEDGALGKLCHVVDVLRRNSKFAKPKYKKNEEDAEEEFLRILDSNIDAKEKALKLTGNILWLEDEEDF